jgi:hypothetical protein
MRSLLTSLELGTAALSVKGSHGSACLGAIAPLTQEVAPLIPTLGGVFDEEREDRSENSFLCVRRAVFSNLCDAVADAFYLIVVEI